MPDGKTFVLGDESVLSCQTEGWRLSWWRDRKNPEAPDREWELWDLTANERVEIADDESVVERLRGELHDYVERIDESESFEEPEADESTEERLEALGYR